MRPPLPLITALLAVGCASVSKPPDNARAPDAAPSRVIAFIGNDLPGALARAKAEGKPLFVDAWAPW
jgi:hypothetical protein